LIPRPAQYLLRFDDLCPTMALDRWERYAELVKGFDIRPILAVVPDNRDPDLRCAKPDPAFWSRMRQLERSGAAIALHGYRHLCLSKGKSMVPGHSKSEFAGVPAELQRQWVHAGIEVLRGHGLNPRIWVAPRHGFDRLTLQGLRDEGIDLVSDGLARMPFLRHGMIWIPQQLWTPVEKSKGLWTICMHANTGKAADLDKMRAFLGQHAARFTSLDRVLTEFRAARLGLTERVYETHALFRARVRNAKASIGLSANWQ
jgi:predicted deacetylase